MASERGDVPSVTRRRLLEAAGVASSTALAGCSGFYGGSSGGTTTDPGSETPTSGVTTARDPEIQQTLSELSLREKAGQMTLAALNGSVDRSTVEELMADPGLGGVLYGAANPGSFDPQTVASTINGYQKRSVEETSHGLGLLTGIDAVHGNATNEDAVVFPHNVGMGATWRPELVRERAEVTSRSMRSMGLNWNYAPVADLLYDPRWGRFYEGFQEFPSAVSKYVQASVEGLQSAGDGTSDVLASVKHFAGYSMPDAGNDRDDARIPVRDLREKVFPPFEDGIDAGTETVMANSGSVNGTPAHASSWLQRTVLREEMGFEGLVVSDWGDIWNLANNHAYLDWTEFEQAAKVVVDAGVDMYMAGRSPERFIDAVVTHVENGGISEERVDRAASRVLAAKWRAGVFDSPSVDVEAVERRVVTDRDHELAREAAEQSMTLLEQGTLPLSDPDTVLVTGPNADDPKAQHGGWTLGWQGLASETTPPTTTVLEGIREQAPSGTTVEHVPTGRQSLSNEQEVADAAADADVVIAVLGEGAYAETDGDIERLALPTGQRALLSTLSEASAPTVGVLIAGRPRGHDHLFETTEGLLMAYYPGSKGGQAVGKALFGAINPGGRLPFNWPKSTGSVPTSNTKRGLPSGDEIRFPTGHGETYTRFLTSSPRLSPSTIDPTATDRVTVEYSVENTGDVRGDHLALGYVFQYGTDATAVPWQRVTDWKRVTLEPGEERTVSFGFPVERLATVDGDVGGDGEWVIPSGKLFVSPKDRRLEAQITETVPLSEL